ncbi:MAG TPA: putative baseplate assembly protein, partial [Dokdonella sp.]
AAPLAYRYRRAGFTLYGNVVRATHGETRNEPLGGGDATRTFQRFTLKSPPLTYVAAPTPDGVASTLQVRVNQLLWKESADLAVAAAAARVYATTRDDAEATTLRFGDGVHGARLPSGPDNVAAVYRSGIGSSGNVRAAQITLATDKPLGVKGVLNPIRASGGADPDTLEQARTNAPLAVTALDRLVSVQDYADFARGFAGIGKSAAILLHADGKSIVHLTVAGIGDEPIDDTSDLYLNLVAALRRYGDPHLALRVQVRDVLALLLQARVAIDPDYAWEDVQPRIRAALLARFGFAASELAQPVFESAILAAIESVRGVVHVSGLQASALDSARLIAGIDPVDALANGDDGGGGDGGGGGGDGAAAIAIVRGGERRAPPWIEVAAGGIAADGSFTPAQIAYLPDVADNLILELAS